MYNAQHQVAVCCDFYLSPPNSYLQNVHTDVIPPECTCKFIHSLMIILISMNFFVIIVWLQFQKLASLVLLIPSVSVRLVTLSPFDRLWLGQPLMDW